VEASSRTLRCGVDEAGRGPLAGPVAAAAVILPPRFPIEVLGDSKHLSEERRLQARRLIVGTATWAVAFASHLEIDQMNILGATFLAMERALLRLPVSPNEILVDGSVTPHFDSQTATVTAVIRADSTVPEVMAASILAKTSRDWWMRHYAPLEPQYCFAAHKGYPTPAHRSVIRESGPSRIQRRSFRVS
jgi:ribonuclease HII